jgi:hypothetical protein
MGLITGLLTLPLAPVRGTVWIAEKLYEQAELEASDGSAIRAGLIELEEMRESGHYGEAELDQAENELIERLMVIRGFTKEGFDGELE